MDIPGKPLDGAEYRIPYQEIVNENQQGKEACKTQNKPVKPCKGTAAGFRKAGNRRQEEAEHGGYQDYRGGQANAKGENNFNPQGQSFFFRHCRRSDSYMIAQASVVSYTNFSCIVVIFKKWTQRPGQ
jgi:hypothetical protein